MQTISARGERAIRLTPARYYTPSGRSIQAKGIDPDVVVEQELPPELQTRAAPALGARRRVEPSGPPEERDWQEGSGSSSYVPKEADKDAQLQYA